MTVIKEKFKWLFREELDIKHRLLNLVLLAALVGGTVSFVSSIFLDINPISNLGVFLLLVMTAVAMWSANVLNKPQITALVVVFLSNAVFFPMIYFTGGGMMSGMPVWVLLGVIFSWLILSGKQCVIMYVLSVISMTVCSIVELLHPEYVVPLNTDMASHVDMIQSMIAVTCVLGAIFKYQSYLYEKQKEQLMRANEAKSDFLSNMSHEIRTPINAVIGMNEMILRESQEPQIREYAVAVQHSSVALLAIINEILDISKIESGKLEIVDVEYELADLIRDCYNMVYDRALKKELTLNLLYDEKLPSKLNGDMVHLRQIIINLLTNAVKYTRKGNVDFIVNGLVKNDEVLLEIKVKDTGIGISDEDKDKLFGKFERIALQDNYSIEGTGLGLHIVQSLTKLMNGNIYVESELGKGSVFTLMLTQKCVDATPIGNVEISSVDDKNTDYNHECEFTAPEAKILVVDDIEMNLNVFVQFLKDYQMQIDLAYSGRESIEMACKKEYDLIFMDHMMPKMNGIEAFETLKTMPENKNENTPFIMLTANALAGMKEHYTAMGFSDYISKPIDGEKLEEMIRYYIPYEKMCFKDKEAAKKYAANNHNEEKEMNLIEKLVSLVGNVNYEKAIKYCAGSEEFYIECLKGFSNDGKCELISQLYENEDWKNYTVEVHTLKSTSRTLGFEEIGVLAERMQTAAEEMNLDYIRANHDEMIHKLKFIKECIEKSG